MAALLQAEDGIRDGRVTGVQTCALPISPLNAIIGLSGVRNSWLMLARKALFARLASSAWRLASDRSEERRVGKVWSFWWASQCCCSERKCSRAAPTKLCSCTHAVAFSHG